MYIKLSRKPSDKSDIYTCITIHNLTPGDMQQCKVSSFHNNSSSCLYLKTKYFLFPIVHSDMEGDFDQFEEVDDDFLSSVCLNLPCEVAPETVVNKQCDSSSSNAVNVNDHGGASTSNHQGEKQLLQEECGKIFV